MSRWRWAGIKPAICHIAKYFPGEGHISIVTNHIREILGVYVQKQ